MEDTKNWRGGFLKLVGLAVLVKEEVASVVMELDYNI
jgi:hypothetical protein